MEIIDVIEVRKMHIGQDEIMSVLAYLQRATDEVTVEERYIVISELLKAIASPDLLGMALEFVFTNKMLAETSISRKLKTDLANFSLAHNAAAFSVLCLYEYFFKMSAWLEEETIAKGGSKPTASFPSLRIRAERQTLSHNLDEVRDFFRRKMTIYATNFANDKPLPERGRHLKKLIRFVNELAYEGNTNFYDRDLDYLKTELLSLNEDRPIVEKKRNDKVFEGIGEDVFDRIASQIEMSEANLSQLYRRMFEDKFIHCKPEKFREWVNDVFDLEIGKIRTKKNKVSEIDRLYVTICELMKRGNFQ